MPRRDAATGCIPSIFAMPRSTGISTKHPHSGPNRSLMLWSAGRWSPPSRVKMRFAASCPRRRRSTFTSDASRSFADSSTNRFVSSAERCASSVSAKRLAMRDDRLERLERHAERPVLAVGGVRVGHLGGERTVDGADHEGAAVLDRRLQRERRRPEGRSRLVHLIGERVRLVRRQIAADAAVDDLRPLARGEVHPVREVSVAEVHVRSRPPPRRLCPDAPHGGRTRGSRRRRYRIPVRCRHRR